MASHFTISKGQAGILLKFLDENIDMQKDLPDMVTKYGAEDALRLIKLRERLESANEDEDDEGE